MWTVGKGMEWEFCPKRGPECRVLALGAKGGFARCVIPGGTHRWTLADWHDDESEPSRSDPEPPTSSEVDSGATGEPEGPRFLGTCVFCRQPITDAQLWYRGVTDPGLFTHLGCPPPEPASDPVNSPDHYRWLPVEAIEITERFNFCMGNALKYILRADHKGNPVEDLRKSLYYIRRELKNRGYEE